MSLKTAVVFMTVRCILKCVGVLPVAARDAMGAVALGVAWDNAQRERSRASDYQGWGTSAGGHGRPVRP